MVFYQWLYFLYIGEYEMKKLLLVGLLLSGCGELTPEQQASSDRTMRISMVQIEIEKLLNDPDSVQYDFKAVNLDNNALCFDYRAKNGVGGYVRNKLVVLADNSVLESKSGYNKHCQPNANYEIY